MRIARFDDNRVGLVRDDGIHDVTSALDQLPAHRYPFPGHDALIANLEILKSAKATRVVPLEKARLLSPVANPGKIMAAPVNYTNPPRQSDQRDPQGRGEGVKLVQVERRNDHEVELAVVIGRKGRNIPAAGALGFVAGYCIGLDMTIRGPEERSLRKSPDSYCVLGPWLVTAEEIPDPGSLELSISVNGAMRQRANTKDLILGVPELIAWASSFYTLHPGDVLLTGTPQGVAPVRPGDVMLASLERVGTMQVTVSSIT